ncbi:hypothetical protein [Pedococcus bigeumensis]|uniref:hypothetical protein n=1 Tax=Pedococcus bigeumensis TaxID=433644 RepID=UPI002FE9CD54
MKRTTITLVALLAALVPAAVGLWGNASFSQAVPVRVPASAEVVTASTPAPGATTTTDDHGGDTPRDQRTEPGDDRDDHSATATSTSRPSGTRTTEAGDDHGGRTPRDQRTEPGDDRDSGSGGSGSDDSSGSGSGGGSDDSGADDSGSHHSGSDDSGSDDSGSHHSGSDDSGSDDHGGHGSDD